MTNRTISHREYFPRDISRRSEPHRYSGAVSEYCASREYVCEGRADDELPEGMLSVSETVDKIIDGDVDTIPEKFAPLFVVAAHLDQQILESGIDTDYNSALEQGLEANLPNLTSSYNLRVFVQKNIRSDDPFTEEQYRASSEAIRDALLSPDSFVESKSFTQELIERYYRVYEEVQ